MSALLVGPHAPNNFSDAVVFLILLMRATPTKLYNALKFHIEGRFYNLFINFFNFMYFVGNVGGIQRHF